MNIIDAHYFLLPSQGNVYSLAKLCMTDGLNKILVSSLRRKVYSFEFLKDSTEGFLQPTVKEILFTYIPSGAEILSIDAFNKSDTQDEFVIGITIIKSSGEPNEETYLNIYSEWEPSSEFNLDNVAQNCLMLELNFIPYQLYHTDLYINTNENEHVKEVIWLLSGNDEKVHMFREDKLNHCYCEVNVVEYFVEFSEPPSIVMWMDVYYCQDLSRRVTAFGCECGFIKLAVVDIWKNEILSSWSSRSEGPVSSVRLFTNEPNWRSPSFVVCPENDNSTTVPSIHLLVTNTLKLSVVYMSVLEHGFGRCRNLPESDQYDAVLSSCIADINMDGEQEILLGTYGQQMLAYQYKADDNDGSSSSLSEVFDTAQDGWELLSKHSFANPIHCLLHLDMTGDGVRELIIVTLRGVHVMQHDPGYVLAKFAERLKELTFQTGITIDTGLYNNEIENLP